MKRARSGETKLRIGPSKTSRVSGNRTICCEVKLCDKAQRFGSIANGSPLNEARGGALNPDGGTFLGVNGQIKNHVCL